MPWINEDGSIYEGLEWPLPDTLSAHPRSSGTFTRFISRYVRDRQTMSLMEGLAKCTILPTRVIEGCAAQMTRKARLQEGCDADIVVFNLETLEDRADFTAMNRPSVGVCHLLVNGVAVITDAMLNPDAAPGRPIRRETS
jgi:N-acyl-D-glutamate deacylase